LRKLRALEPEFFLRSRTARPDLISERRTGEALSEIEQLSSSDEIARVTSVVYWMAGRRAEPTALLG
jgi:hypothetical protein